MKARTGRYAADHDPATSLALAARMGRFGLGRPWLVECGLLFGVDLIAMISVWPFREITCNDAWSFALTVMRWIETGQLHIVDWSPSTLVAHLAWGRLWAGLLGPHLSSLIVANWTMGFAAGAAVLGVGHLLGWPRPVRICAAALLLYNPAFFCLRFTFMGDVSFVAFLAVAAFFWLALFKEPNALWVAGCAGIFSAAAVAVRQPGIFLPVSFVLAVVTSRRDLLKARGLWVALGVFGALSAGILFWYYGIQSPSPVNQNATRIMVEALRSPGTWLVGVLSRFIEFSLTVALLCVPLILLIRPRLRGAWAGAPCLAILLGYVFLFKHHLPFMMSLIHPWGLGPTATTQGNLAPLAGRAAGPLWMGLTVLLCILVAGYLPTWIRLCRRPGPHAGALSFVLWAGLLQFPFVLIYPWVQDRSSLPLCLFAVLALGLLAARSGPWRRLPGLLLLGLTACLSTLGTRDCLNWNEARWTLAHRLVKGGLSPFFLEGGWEFDLTHLFSYCEAYPGQRVRPKDQGACWWLDYVPCLDPVYRISFSASSTEPVADVQPWRSPFRQGPLQLFALGPRRTPQEGRKPTAIVLSLPQLDPGALLAFGSSNPLSPGIDALLVGARRYAPSDPAPSGLQGLKESLAQKGYAAVEWQDGAQAGPGIEEWPASLKGIIEGAQPTLVSMTVREDRPLDQVDRLAWALFRALQPPERVSPYMLFIAGKDDALLGLFPSPDGSLLAAPQGKLQEDVDAFLATAGEGIGSDAGTLQASRPWR